MELELRDVQVTVVIPTYNADHLIASCLGSIPDDPRIEIIVVDDGSTADSLERLKALLLHHDRCRLIEAPHRGPGSARQEGVDSASGRFVCFVDADDLVRPDGFSTAVSVAVGMDPDLLIMGTAKDKSECPPPPPEGAAIASINYVAQAELGREIPVVWGKLYRTEFLRLSGITFPSQYPAEDVWFWWRVCSQRPLAISVDCIGYAHQTDSDASLTRSAEYVRLAAKTLISMAAEVEGTRWERRAGWRSIYRGYLYLGRRSGWSERLDMMRGLATFWSDRLLVFRAMKRLRSAAARSGR